MYFPKKMRQGLHSTKFKIPWNMFRCRYWTLPWKMGSRCNNLLGVEDVIPFWKRGRRCNLIPLQKSKGMFRVASSSKRALYYRNGMCGVCGCLAV